VWNLICLQYNAVGDLWRSWAVLLLRLLAGGEWGVRRGWWVVGAESRLTVVAAYRWRHLVNSERVTALLTRDHLASRSISDMFHPAQVAVLVSQRWHRRPPLENAPAWFASTTAFWFTQIVATRHVASAQNIPIAITARAPPDPGGGAYSTPPGPLAGFKGRFCIWEGRAEYKGGGRSGSRRREGWVENKGRGRLCKNSRAAFFVVFCLNAMFIHSQSLRPRRHKLVLTTKCDSRNFFERQLFKDMFAKWVKLMNADAL